MKKCHRSVLGLKFWSVCILLKSAGSNRSQSLFYFVPQEKGLIKSQSFTCALIGLHHSWVWQICEVITFCKYLNDIQKSDSFNQVNELKKNWQVQMSPWHVTS